MEPAGDYPSYSTMLDSIRIACTNNYKILLCVYEYALGFRKALGNLKATADELTYEKLSAQFPKIPDELTSVVNAKFTEILHELMERGFKPSPAFDIAISSFDKLSYNIGSLAEEYESRTKEIIAKGERTLETLQEATDAAAVAHEHYVQAGESLKTAFAQKSSRLQEYRTAFQAAQKHAVDLHNKMNNIRGLVTTEFGEALTDFEATEVWRVENWSSAFGGFADSLNEMAGILFSMNNVITRIIDEGKEDIAELYDTGFLKNAAASPRYQTVTVPSIASKWLDMEKFFQSDIKAGGVLYRANQDFKGNHEQLDVKKDEVFVCLENRGDQAWCKDINESKGLLPLSVMELVE